MTKEQAGIEADKIARNDQIEMVVVFNPYAEEPRESYRYGFYPASAARIFQHDETVETIPAGGRVAK